MPHRVLLVAALLAAAAATPAPMPVAAQAAVTVAALPFDPLPFDQGASGLGLALRRLGTAARVLYVTAHPDDEDSALLVALARGRGARVELFTLTRGAGGLNETGPELFQELSVLRTAETAARTRHDAVEQRFGRADDFGYSFSVEECWQRWGRQEMLGDVVAMVRRLRPDLIITMPAANAGGGAAHSASAQLAAEAFTAAADGGRFPDQLAAGLRPWQAHALYEAGVGGGAAPPGTGLLALDTGAGDPLLGMSWAELGSLARASHRSQSMRTIKAPLAAARTALRLARRSPEGPAPPPRDLLEPELTDVAALGRRFGGPAPALAAAQEAARRAQALYDARDPAAVLPALEDGLRALQAAAGEAAALGEPARGALLDRIADEQRDFAAALALAMGLSVEPVAETADVVPGTPVQVTTRVRTSVAAPRVEEVTLRGGAAWTVRALEAPAVPAPGSVAVRHEALVAPGTAPTRPHWTIEPGAGRNRMAEVPDPTLPWSPPELQAVLRIATGAGPVEVQVPVYAEAPALTPGGRRTLLRVVPALSVQAGPAVLPFAPAERTRAVRVRTVALGAQAGRASVRLEAPPGWQVAPAAATVAWTRPREEASAVFQVRPPAGAGGALLRAVATSDGREYAQEWAALDHAHVHSRPYLRAAVVRVPAERMQRPPAVRIGYVEGAGDVVAASIEALGLGLRRLGPQDLAVADLSALSTIVLGVRAYQGRPDLHAHHERLMEFARRGGHLVLQLSRAELNQLEPLPYGSVPPARADSPFAPFPGRVGSGRVTEETAAVTLLAPAHPLLRRPHRLGPRDFEGWVQERGSFLFEAGDPRYVELLAASDPFPENPGPKKGLLTTARVGRGSWTYVGLNLFRQLYVGTPGAYRILANLLARPRGDGP